MLATFGLVRPSCHIITAHVPAGHFFLEGPPGPPGVIAAAHLLLSADTMRLLAQGPRRAVRRPRHGVPRSPEPLEQVCYLIRRPRKRCSNTELRAGTHIGSSLQLRAVRYPERIRSWNILCLVGDRRAGQAGVFRPKSQHLLKEGTAVASADQHIKRKARLLSHFLVDYNETGVLHTFVLTRNVWWTVPQEVDCASPLPSDLVLFQCSSLDVALRRRGFLPVHLYCPTLWVSRQEDSGGAGPLQWPHLYKLARVDHGSLGAVAGGD
jgi:hypothetical protein